MTPDLLFVVQSAGTTYASFDASHVSSPVNTSSRLLYVPSYVALASIVVFLLHAVFNHFQKLIARHKISSMDTSDQTSETLSDSFLDLHGGRSIVTFRALRAVGSVVLFALSIVVAVINHTTHPAAQQTQWAESSLCVTFFYTSVLSIISFAYPTKSSKVTPHLTTILLATWTVFFIRDVMPFATYTLQPADISYGWPLWIFISVLTLVSVVIPLLTPRKYIPVDPLDPREPSPEQISSPLSWILFTYLDPIILKANKIEHLPFSELPPLPDTMSGAHLVAKAFPQIDSFHPAASESLLSRTKNPRTRLLLGLIYTFRRNFLIIALVLALHVCTLLLSPFGMSQVLQYIEGGGEGAVVRPWVWVGSLFVAPFAASVLVQLYFFYYSKTGISMEALLTQMVLEHALRIRLVAATGSNNSNTTSRAGSSASSVINQNITVAGNSEGEAAMEGEETTLVSSASSAKVADVAPQAQDSEAENLIGKMNNLISTDLENIQEGADFMQLIFDGPVLIIAIIIYLYQILGWSALAGLGSMIVLLPVPIFLANRLQGVTVNVTKKSDSRVSLVTETLGVVRMIKLFGWERTMSDKIDKKREDELAWVWKAKIFTLLTENTNMIIPAITMMVTYGIYTLVMGKTLDAATVFPSISLFDHLRWQVVLTFRLVPVVIRGKVSLDRIADFLNKTELLDAYDPESDDNVYVDQEDDGASSEIGFRAAAFTWSNADAEDGTLTPSRRRFRLRIEDELLFKRGKINLIVGSTGCGKTSLLMALLGEMHFVPSGVESWFNLPRDKGVAYAAQESWVMNETIKENILFGAPFDEERYAKVIHQCSLERDLSLFEAGDETEVGEKGLTLSGGQKARLTLARAIYSSADILLLDDVLAALDVHTAKWVVDKCFKGDLVKGRTVLLVTHNVAMASPIADFVVSLSSDGQILSQGTISDALAKNHKLELKVAREQEIEEKADEVVDAETPEKKSNGKLIVEEEVAVGHLSWGSMKMYLSALGGLWFWVPFLSATFLECTVEVVQPWFLGYWATQYTERPANEINVPFYMGGYTLLVAAMLIIFFIAQAFLTFGALKASRSLHRRLMDSILCTTLRWLDKTPTARILTRCTKDISSIDSTIPQNLSWLVELIVLIIVRFVAIILWTPIFGLLGVFILAIGGILGQIYIRAQLSVKREMSKAKAPVMSHFGASIEGITSIRAYGAQDVFKQKSITHIDKYSQAARVNINLNRWVGVRVDALGGLFAAALAAYFVYGRSGVNASDSGFSLSMAIAFGSFVLFLVKTYNQFEVQGNSLERIQEYTKIEQEAQPFEGGTPPAHWPSSGELRVEKLSARYSVDGPHVLHEISFHVKSGERVGIVGRTGSGKSSLTLSLLRCIITEGNAYYDGIPISSLNLDALRSNITIIPQMPELLSGTLRQNLDPFDDYEDATLNSALRSAGLYSIQNDDNENRLTLDSAIARGGGNLSVGQRQIIALARAMVRESKLLILDEATSAIDYKTDSVIQTSLRNELSKDVTVLTIAHRLQTIMDADKIMVLDAGHIAEFDAPYELLKKENGIFRSLVDESGDKEILYAVAEKKAFGSRK